MSKPKLPPEVAEKYSLNPNLKGGPRYDFGKYGVIDVSQLSIQLADQLFAAGFPHLRKAAPKAEKEAKPKKQAKTDTKD